MTPTEETHAYVTQIISACRESSDPEFMVTNLLKEYAGKVYRASRREMVEEIAKLAP